MFEGMLKAGLQPDFIEKSSIGTVEIFKIDLAFCTGDLRVATGDTAVIKAREVHLGLDVVRFTQPPQQISVPNEIQTLA